MSIRELNEMELEVVAGGFRGVLGSAIMGEIVDRFSRGVVDLATSAVQRAGRWLVESAPGGADQGTWERIGHSGLSA